jgi:hypothetical protein
MSKKWTFEKLSALTSNHLVARKMLYNLVSGVPTEKKEVRG